MPSDQAIEARERRERVHRLNDLRERLSAPLETAAENLKEHLNLLLLDSPAGYFQRAKYATGDAGIAEAVDSSTYLFCLYFFWRFELQSSMQFESVTAEDNWQYAVDHAVQEVSKAVSSTDAKFAAWDGEVKPAGLPAEAQLFPYYVSEQGKRAISELLGDKDFRPGGPIKAARMPMPYTQFCLAMREPPAPQPSSRRNGYGTALPQPLPPNPYPELARWAMPLKLSSKRFAALVTKGPLTASERRELDRTKARLQALANELADLLFVLYKSPTDKWFRKKQALTGSVVADMEAKEREKAERKEAGLGPGLLGYRALGRFVRRLFFFVPGGGGGKPARGA